MAREGHARVPATYREDGYRLGGWVHEQRNMYREGQLDAERRARLEALPGWTWFPYQTAWEEGFSQLEAFIAREGHARVPLRWREDGFRLGSWVNTNRTHHNRGDLRPDRAARLKALPGWSWDLNDAAWEEGFARLEAFVAREGHARVPKEWCEEGGFRLGQWVHNIRGRESDPERRVRLEGLPGWSWDSREAAWEEGFSHLEKFVARERHARVPGGHAEDGFRLGGWVAVQRQTYQKGTLDPARHSRLAALPGWTWDTLDAAWEDGYSRLRQFAEDEGHSRVPQQYRSDDGYRLGVWVTNKRQARKQGRLSKERQRLLEALPGWTWHPHETAWDDGYARLLEFVAREGHSRVPTEYHDNDDDCFRLGGWVAKQRQDYLKGALDAKRRAQLEALPGWTWDPLDTAWEDGYARLVDFAAREGHARVPEGYQDDDGFKLGQWVQNLRPRGRRGALSIERVRQLESLPGWTWHPRETAWEKGYARLREFVAREGHGRVPQEASQDGFRLGRWVANLRRDYRQGTLDQDRRARLEALPDWTWDTLETAWEEACARLLEFVAREGHPRVPEGYQDDGGFKLGLWVQNQRARGRRGKVSDERARRLESVPGWTWGSRQRSRAR